MLDSAPWVTASEAGQVSFCPNTVYLKQKGAKHSAKAQKNMDVGTMHHKIETDGKSRAVPVFAIVIAVLFLAVIAFIVYGWLA